MGTGPLTVGRPTAWAPYSAILSNMGRGDSERRCIDLVCEVLRTQDVVRQYRFPFLRGDPTPKRRDGVTLPVDAYFPAFRLVVEYMGEQHSKENPLMDRRLGRRTQRERYQARRTEIFARGGFRLVRLWHHESIDAAMVATKLEQVGIVRGNDGSWSCDPAPKRAP